MPDKDENEPQEVAESAASPKRDGLGVWSVVAGALVLFPIALILGHLGLRASKQGTATNRSVALAGVILGYVGLVAVLVTTAVVLFVAWPKVTAHNADVAAKTDVISIGNAAVEQALGTGAMPTLGTAVTGYAVGDASVTAALEPAGIATIAGELPLQWCVNLSYEGGTAADVSFSSTGGLMTSANCR